MHEVDFKVPLSGSQLFDTHSYVTAQHICNMFPSLSFEIVDKQIWIHGELNDFWFEKWNEAVFKVGEYGI